MIFSTNVSFILFIILFLLFGIVGGQISKNSGRPFWIGFAIGIIGNILGILLLIFITKSGQKRTFNPRFKEHTDSKLSAIKQLAELNKKGKLSDEEFERLKQEIIGTID